MTGEESKTTQRVDTDGAEQELRSLFARLFVNDLNEGVTGIANTQSELERLSKSSRNAILEANVDLGRKLSSLQSFSEVFVGDLGGVASEVRDLKAAFDDAHGGVAREGVVQEGFAGIAKRFDTLDENLQQLAAVRGQHGSETETIGPGSQHGASLAVHRGSGRSIALGFVSGMLFGGLVVFAVLQVLGT